MTSKEVAAVLETTVGYVNRLRRADKLEARWNSEGKGGGYLYCMASVGEFISNRSSRRVNAHKTKEKAQSYISKGYRVIYKPEHPRSYEGYIAEHTVVMEEHLGRLLVKGECVHHKDRDKLNNSIDNLTLLTDSRHMKMHSELRGLLLKISNDPVKEELAIAALKDILKSAAEKG